MLPAPAAHGASGRVRIFGGILATDRSLPGLPVAQTISDGHFAAWSLQTSDSDGASGTHSDGARVIGRLDYSNGAVVTLAVAHDTLEILVSDTGRYTLAADGRTIAHRAPAQVDRAAVALDLIGVVMPTLLHRDGAWCVHASAVQTPAGVLAFVASSGTGKSTLAAACVQAGCALVADDVVVLRETAAGVSVTPAGVPLRLHSGTARAVGVRAHDADEWGKVRVPGALTQETLPLDAIYVLQAANADTAVARAPRATRAAALALLANGKITALLGGAAAGDALSRCVSLAHRITAYDLAIPRDLARLGSVTEQILSWHTLAPARWARP